MDRASRSGRQERACSDMHGLHALHRHRRGRVVEGDCSAARRVGDAIRREPVHCEIAALKRSGVHWLVHICGERSSLCENHAADRGIGAGHGQTWVRFNRAHKQRPIFCEGALDWGPRIGRIVPPVTPGETNRVARRLIRRHEDVGRRCHPTHADVNAAGIDREVHRRNVVAVPHRRWTREDCILRGHRHGPQFAPWTSPRPIIGINHKVDRPCGRTAGLRAHRHANRAERGRIGRRREFIDESHLGDTGEWVAAVAVLNRAVVVDHDARFRIAVDDRGRTLDGRTGRELCLLRRRRLANALRECRRNFAHRSSTAA